MTEGGQERENVNRERAKLGLMEGVRKGGKKRDRNKKKRQKKGREAKRGSSSDSSVGRGAEEEAKNRMQNK